MYGIMVPTLLGYFAFSYILTSTGIILVNDKSSQSADSPDKQAAKAQAEKDGGSSSTLRAYTFSDASNNTTQKSADGQVAEALQSPLRLRSPHKGKQVQI